MVEFYFGVTESNQNPYQTDAWQILRAFDEHPSK